MSLWGRRFLYFTVVQQVEILAWGRLDRHIGLCKIAWGLKALLLTIGEIYDVPTAA